MGQVGGNDALDAAPPGTPGLREVLCHFKVVTSAQGWWVRDRCKLAPMGDPGGHAATTRVLVVDDEPSIRLLCRVNLELDGHEVLEASSLGTARGALEEEEVDVVVLDVHLYNERSDALVAECHARRPPIPVVLVTGSVEITDAGLSDADAILPKPFELDQLLSTVRNLARAHAPR
jgi:CheY-like chemotaxis protein